jgi:hypothetical protein
MPTMVQSGRLEAGTLSGLGVLDQSVHAGLEVTVEDPAQGQ